MPEQVLSVAAYRRIEENRKSVSQLFAGLALLLMLGLCYLLLPVLAPLVGELLGNAIGEATQPAGG